MNTAISSRDERAFSAPALLVAGAFFMEFLDGTVIATALNLPKDLLRKIQKFDFTKKNPKLIYINPTEERISLEDSILTAFLSLVGFDVLFFVPTGYQCIEQHFTRPFASETQIGDYLYDLRIPDFNTVQESGLHSIRKLFGRSI